MDLIHQEIEKYGLIAYRLSPQDRSRNYRPDMIGRIDWGRLDELENETDAFFEERIKQNQKNLLSNVFSPKNNIRLEVKNFPLFVEKFKLPKSILNLYPGLEKILIIEYSSSMQKLVMRVPTTGYLLERIQEMFGPEGKNYRSLEESYHGEFKKVIDSLVPAYKIKHLFAKEQAARVLRKKLPEKFDEISSEIGKIDNAEFQEQVAQATEKQLLTEAKDVKNTIPKNFTDELK